MVHCLREMLERVVRRSLPIRVKGSLLFSPVCSTADLLNQVPTPIVRSHGVSVLVCFFHAPCVTLVLCSVNHEVLSEGPCDLSTECSHVVCSQYWLSPIVSRSAGLVGASVR